MSDEFRQFWFDGLLPNMWSIRSDDCVSSSWYSYYEEPESPTDKYLGNLVQEKEIYVKNVILDILNEKKQFLCNIHKINQEVKDAVNLINDVVLKKEQILKGKLRSVIDEKEEHWNSQLETCQKALFWLENLKNDNPLNSLINVEAFDSICNTMFIKSMEERKRVKVEVDTEDFSLLKVLQNIGRLVEQPTVCYPCKRKYTVLPKLILGTTGNNGSLVKFCRPWGVFSDSEGRILVSDRSNDRIVVFNSFGKFLFEFGKSGSGRGEFSRPAGITVDNSNRILVCDKDNHRIQIFDFYGIYLFEFGAFGCENGQFNYPWDIAVNSSREIAVSDSKNRRVQLFDSQGNYLSQYKAKGFDCPRGLVFTPEGLLLVTDFNKHTVVLLNKGLKKIKSYCREGNSPGKLFRPQGIACLKNGFFAVSDSKNFRIQVFDQNGNFKNAFGTEGTEPGQFNCPQGIACHTNGDLIVVDLSNNRVQIFHESEVIHKNFMNKTDNFLKH